MQNKLCSLGSNSYRAIMGDSRRFNLFADFIERQIANKNARIADVAAGKGYLSLALRQRGYKNVISFEPKARPAVKGLQYKAKYFEGGEFDVIVGMHPDQATDVILDEATRNRALAIVVPCCALPTRWSFKTTQHVQKNGIPSHRQNATYSHWIRHLKNESFKRGLELSETLLPMGGRNIVLYGRKR